MKIINVKVKDLIPYATNPRRNSEAVDRVAESIRQFGFKVPMVIDKNNVIVAGHTRLLASLKLGLESVPCVVADDLTDEQIKAFRLADNKVAEFSEWDETLLKLELSDIDTINMSDFGFDALDDIEDWPDDDSEHFDVSQTFDKYLLNEFDPDRTEGRFQMPIIEPCDHVPKRLIGFNYMLTSDDKSAGIHYFVDDYQFERLWNDPDTYIAKIKWYDCTLTPDFSLYLDMPTPLKIWNIYRSRLLGQMMQDRGCNVIPTVSWAYKDSFDYCFDGLPKRSVLAVSSVGVKQSKVALDIWIDGMKEMIKRCEPTKILLYGGRIDMDYQGVEIIEFKNEVTERMKKHAV